MNRLRPWVVEDSPIVRDKLAETLGENAPAQVVGCAEDAGTAATWLFDAGDACDVVIVDIFLKAGAGPGLLKRLQAKGVSTARVVLSNHATSDIRAKCLELGAAEVFDKSNEIDEMRGYLNRLADAPPSLQAS